MSSNNGSEKQRIIKTQDETGDIYNFELIDVVEFEGKEYGLLVYVDEEGNPISEEKIEEEDSEQDSEEEVVVMKLIKGEEGYTFETIEDDEEFEKVVSYLETEEEEEEQEEEEF
jgi:hypothetical protein